MNRIQTRSEKREIRTRRDALEDPRTLDMRKPINWRPMIAAVVMSAFLGISARARNPNASIPVWLLIGVALGSIFMGLREFDRRVRLRNFLLNALAHALIYSLMLTVAFAVIFGVGMIGGKISWNQIGQMRGYFVTAYSAFLAWMCIVFSIIALSRKLGKGVLWNWLRGYYHQPKCEERVVMFLDLQGSTELAENLGDEQFSAFIRDFFADLTRPVVCCKGDISHYIGDEAVITWKVKAEPIPAKAVQCFFAFDHVIAFKEQQYMAKYGCVPRFKAGIHAGPVMVTEVGEAKSEFVLHGDTLNVASRIQGLCGKLGERVLLSSSLAARLRPEQWLALCDKGREDVKGKTESVTVVAASLV